MPAGTLKPATPLLAACEVLYTTVLLELMTVSVMVSLAVVSVAPPAKQPAATSVTESPQICRVSGWRKAIKKRKILAYSS